jgi:hypothetical protein
MRFNKRKSPGDDLIQAFPDYDYTKTHDLSCHLLIRTPRVGFTFLFLTLTCRARIDQKAEDQFDDQNLRDVTDSSKVRQDQA